MTVRFWSGGTSTKIVILILREWITRGRGMDFPQLSKIRQGDRLVAFNRDIPSIPPVVVHRDGVGLYVMGMAGRVYLQAGEDGAVIGFKRPPLENA